MAVSKRLRYEILRRDNHACRYCGAHAPDAVLTVDHVVPVTLGGGDDPANLVTACRDCNSGKSATSTDSAIVADVAQDALRWAAAMQLASERAQLDRDARYATVEEFYMFWGAAAPRWARLPDDWESSVAKFIALGLTGPDILEAAGTAATKRNVADGQRWRYFCGTCWGYLRDRQAAALQIVQPPETPTERDPAPITAEARAAATNYNYLAAVCDGPERPAV